MLTWVSTDCLFSRWIIFHCKVKWSESQSCPTLCDPRDYTVHGILQARILEWVAIPFLGNLPNPGIKPRSPVLQADSLPAEPSEKPKVDLEWKGRHVDHKEAKFHCKDKPIPPVNGYVSWFQLRLSQVILDTWRGTVKERLLFPFLLKKITRKKLNMTDGHKKERHPMYMERLSENIPSFCLRSGDLNIIFL